MQFRGVRGPNQCISRAVLPFSAPGRVLSLPLTALLAPCCPWLGAASLQFLPLSPHGILLFSVLRTLLSLIRVLVIGPGAHWIAQDYLFIITSAKILLPNKITFMGSEG